MTLTLGRHHYQQLLAHVQAAYPLEACGLLAGRDGQIYHHYPIENRLQSQTAYEMEPLQQLEAMLDLEDQGWQMTAVYHSHPHGPAAPSATDIRQAYYPDTLHLIVSLADRQRPSVRAFQIDKEQVTEIGLMIL